ncbi:hypothetical protein ACHAW5_010209 [Stephanodiscus triporus]|uniref:Uncharacterized protein n=1 Tax=Stephanodiscus triporus TaxID=2934178 RepID=A0ABD3R033_9STRA
MDTIGNDLSSGGQVLSQEELVEKRQRNGQCTTCGAKCFKKKVFKLEPITVPGLVLDGRCLTCFPQDPSMGEELVAACSSAEVSFATSSIAPKRSVSKGAFKSFRLVGDKSKGRRSTSGDMGGDMRGFRQSTSSCDNSSFGDAKDFRKSTSSCDNNLRSSHRLPSIEDEVYVDGGKDDGRKKKSVKGKTKRKSDRSKSPAEGESIGGSHRSLDSSGRQASFLKLRTRRPSSVFLEGIDLEGLLIDDDGDQNKLLDSNGSSKSLPSSNAAELTREERKALRSLNKKNTSFLEIVNIMMINSQSVPVQNEGLHMLSLCQDPDRELLAECASIGGFEVIVSAMGKCSKDAMAQTDACKVLFVASAHGKVLQIAMADAGCIEALAFAMNEFKDDNIVLEGCLLALSNLCIPESNAQDAIDARIVELTVNAMTKSVDMSGLQEHGCAILANLAVHQSARGRIRDSGGCDAIVMSMVVHLKDVGVQSEALIAVRNLCVKDDESKVLLAKSGAIDVIVQVMRDHKDEAIIQAYGSWALSAIGLNEDNQAYIGQNGVDVIIGSMRDHADDLNVQEKACQALWTLSVHPRNKGKMVAFGAIGVIVSTMRNLASEPSIQELGCGVLSNMAANDDSIKVQVVNSGALEVVVMAMVLHGEDEDVQGQAVALLYKLCIPENIKSMVDANVSPMMAIATSIPNCEQMASYVLTQLEST